MIYLDNAATGGFKPNCVIEETVNALKASANPTRSSHFLATAMAEKVFDLRKSVAKLFSFQAPERVIFTKNCTESLNTAIFGSVKPLGHVIVDCYAHNSLLRPIHYLKTKGLIDYTVVYPEGPMLPVTAKDVKNAMRRNTYLVAITHVSNVTGTENDVEGIGKYLDGSNVLFLVDGAQSAGHIDINMTKCGISYLCLPAHKGLCCPTGLGFLLVNEKAPLRPHLFGGTGTKSLDLVQPEEFPEGFESGTLPTAAIAGGLAGIKYVTSRFDEIKAKLIAFRKLLYENIPKGIKLFSVPNDSGMFTFDFHNIDPSEAADIFNFKHDIAIRYGYFCAPLIHNFIGSSERGLIRSSFSSFNPLSDGYYLLECIEKMTKEAET